MFFNALFPYWTIQNNSQQVNYSEKEKASFFPPVLLFHCADLKPNNGQGHSPEQTSGCIQSLFVVVVYLSSSFYKVNEISV